MAEARILIVGGSGVFGRRLALELLERTTAALVISSRSLRVAERTCADLGAPDRASAVALDLNDVGALAGAAEGCVAVACTAGPFQSLPRAVVAEAVAAGAHWLDIADTRAWVDGLLADDRFVDRATAIMPGLSSTPALTGALTDWCRARLPNPMFARAAMYIGNRNEKGAGAVASAIAEGFGDPARVEFPGGARTAYRFDVPSSAFGASNMSGEFRVALEMAPAARFVNAFSNAGEPVRFGRALARVAKPFSNFGSDEGCVQAEVTDRNGTILAAACRAKGQGLAILPIAIAIEEILSGSALRGVVHPAGWIEPERLLARMNERGVTFCRRVVEARLVR